jgi:hypothetical protein
LHIDRMLDIDLIFDLRSERVKCRTFLKNEIKKPSTSIFAQAEDGTVHKHKQRCTRFPKIFSEKTYSKRYGKL